MLKCLLMATKKTSQTPPGGFRQSLFWDVDPATIDPEKHARYIIERVLQSGDSNEIEWLFKFYLHQRIRQVLKRERVQVDKQARALSCIRTIFPEILIRDSIFTPNSFPNYTTK